MLELENVRKSYLHHDTLIKVLEEVDLSIQPGETLAVMGASGVGKSTLLNIMGSLEPPTEGTVKFQGRNIYELDEQALCRFRNDQVGFVFQFHHLLPEFSALENAMMPALIARKTRVQAVQMAREVLETVGLEGRLKHRAGELSGGEQQRVAIARALIMKPKLILADEPTGNLDWRTGREIVDLLIRLNTQEGLAIVVATHNQSLATRMSRRMEIVGGQIRS